VLETLRALSPDALDPCADTGVRAVFRGRNEGRCTAFRADMDALCVVEETGRSDTSEHTGRMHACGHDGHMACLLALARLIAARRGKLKGDVVLLFQPAEETVGGAKRMIDEGALSDPAVKVIYGMHLMPDLPLGSIATCAGALMAQNCELDITLRGRTAHGAMPHKGADAVAAAAHLYTLLQTTVTRRIDPYERALISVGVLRAGEQRNVIAERALLQCTMRAFSDEVSDALRGYILDDLRAVEAAFGVRCEMEEPVNYPCVFNHEEETRRLMEIVGDGLLAAKPRMVAEDFSYYQRVVPGVYFLCGCMEEGRDAPLHNGRFDFDERALLYSLQVFNRLIAW
jgi:amidohydrolase